MLKKVNGAYDGCNKDGHSEDYRYSYISHLREFNLPENNSGLWYLICNTKNITVLVLLQLKIIMKPLYYDDGDNKVDYEIYFSERKIVL